MASLHTSQPYQPWSKGKLVGQKAPLKLKNIWAIRVRLQLRDKVRDLALFNLAIDSKLRACDLVKISVSGVSHGGLMASRAMMQQKTGRPAQFEIAAMTREAVHAWIKKADLSPSDFLFTSRVTGSPHLLTSQYARIVHHWVEDAGLDTGSYGTHTMRRTSWSAPAVPCPSMSTK